MSGRKIILSLLKRCDFYLFLFCIDKNETPANDVEEQGRE